MNRRDFFLSSLAVAGAPAAGRELKCRADGTFKILMISDQHYVPEPERRGIELTEKLIALENADLVVAVGDCISGKDCPTAADLERATANVAAAMEKARVPWAITLGNHDPEHSPKTGLGKPQLMSYYERYPHNLNAGWAREIHGAGNKSILIWNAAGSEPVFNVWLIDSGDHPPNNPKEYDWIHTDQILWYYQTSKDLERRYGRKIPSLMFFHIPLLEFAEMANSKKVIGQRQEPEATPKVNSGMFAAVMERGDVKGIFCGHDHVNNYVGQWRGVLLGYDGIVGFRGYPHTPPDDISNERARGGRAFLINERDPWTFKTWMRFKDGSTNWELASESYMRDHLK